MFHLDLRLKCKAATPGQSEVIPLEIELFISYVTDCYPPNSVID